MFDFDHWCSWVETESQQRRVENVTIEFQRGKPSPKRAATVNLMGENKLFQFAFWESGEADFYGIDLTTGKTSSISMAAFWTTSLLSKHSESIWPLQRLRVGRAKRNPSAVTDGFRFALPILRDRPTPASPSSRPPAAG
jgi:hypothetical protein